MVFSIIVLTISVKSKKGIQSNPPGGISIGLLQYSIDYSLPTLLFWKIIQNFEN